MITNRLAVNMLLCRINGRSVELHFQPTTNVLYFYEIEGGAADLEAALILETVLSKLVLSRDVSVDYEYEYPVYSLNTRLNWEVRS